MTTAERRTLSAVQLSCHGTASCLTTSHELLNLLPSRVTANEQGIENLLYDLERDGYLYILLSERKGKRVYLLELTEKAKTYFKTRRQMGRDIEWKLLLAVLGAIVTFIVGILLKGIFRT